MSAVAGTAAVVGVSVAVSTGTSQETSGRETCRPGHCLVLAARGDIYSINDDGSGLAQLTSAAGEDFSPSWSADGEEIAFRSDRNGTDALFVMNADGSNVREWRLPGHPEGLVWAPNGLKLAYSGGERDDDHTNGDIWVINPDGSGHARVSGPRGPTNEFPSWSPDSRRITYASTRGAVGDERSLWIVSADGSGRRRLSAAGSHSSWSPSGTRIVFARAGGSGAHRLWLVRPDGKKIRRLGRFAAEFPAWSPDGRRIAYAVARGGIGFVDTRGQARGRIAASLGEVGWPSWRPR